MASHWLKNWKSLKIFFRTTEWIETRFSQNAGTAHPQELRLQGTWTDGQGDSYIPPQTLYKILLVFLDHRVKLNQTLM
jgi:hypothetical protein